MISVKTARLYIETTRLTLSVLDIGENDSETQDVVNFKLRTVTQNLNAETEFL